MKRLAELRIAKGLTQRGFAALFNLSGGNVCDYEKGRIEPNIQKLIAFANYFECSIDYLVGREDELGLVNTNANLTPFQNQLLAVVDKLETPKQHQVLGYIEALVSKK